MKGTEWEAPETPQEDRHVHRPLRWAAPSVLCHGLPRGCPHCLCLSEGRGKWVSARGGVCWPCCPEPLRSAVPGRSGCCSAGGSAAISRGQASLPFQPRWWACTPSGQSLSFPAPGSVGWGSPFMTALDCFRRFPWAPPKLLLPVSDCPLSVFSYSPVTPSPDHLVWTVLLSHPSWLPAPQSYRGLGRGGR